MKKPLLIAFGILGGCYAFSQSVSPEVIASSGEYYTSTNATLSWTIGESIIEIYSNANNILTQGFQQSSYSVTAIEETLNSNYRINAYPNPASDFIIIDVQSEEQSVLHVELIDIQGRSIYNQIIKGNNKQIDLRPLGNSIYLLKISTDKGKHLKTYKIQKVN